MHVLRKEVVEDLAMRSSCGMDVTGGVHRVEVAEVCQTPLSFHVGACHVRAGKASASAKLLCKLGAGIRSHEALLEHLVRGSLQALQGSAGVPNHLHAALTNLQEVGKGLLVLQELQDDRGCAQRLLHFCSRGPHGRRSLPSTTARNIE